MANYEKWGKQFKVFIDRVAPAQAAFVRLLDEKPLKYFYPDAKTEYITSTNITNWIKGRNVPKTRQYHIYLIARLNDFDCFLSIDEANEWLADADFGYLTPSEIKEIFKVDKTDLPVIPKMILIDGNELKRGKNNKVYQIPSYYISKTPITNKQYAGYVKAHEYKVYIPSLWEYGEPPKEIENHPVVGISWYDACDYCSWLSKVFKQIFQLPTEAQWIKASGVEDGRRYPWGIKWQEDPPLCNGGSTSTQYTTPVGSYPDGASPYGVYDMVGNVWEFTRDAFAPEASEVSKQASMTKDALRIIKGGSFCNNENSLRCKARNTHPSNQRENPTIGFRIVRLMT